MTIMENVKNNFENLRISIRIIVWTIVWYFYKMYKGIIGRIGFGYINRVGRLYVRGNSEAVVVLGYNFPKRVGVKFVDFPGGCDIDSDQLSHMIIRRWGVYILVIKWRVRFMREIVWEVTI